MSLFFAGVVVFQALTVLGVLSWLVRASTPGERLLAVSLSGSLGVSLVLLLAEAAEMPVLKDVALVLAVLGAVAVSTAASRPGVARERAR